MSDNFSGVTLGDLTCASHSAAGDLPGVAMAVRRRHERWPDSERARITAESFTPGAAVAQVARRNGVSLGLLHYWRRQARASGVVEELRLVPVTVTSEGACEPGRLDLAIRDVTVRIAGAVDIEQLRTVLAAIRA